MRRPNQLSISALKTLGLLLVWALRPSLGQAASPHGLGQALGPSTTSYVYSYVYPTFSYWPYGGYFSPFPSYPIISSPYPYMPNYWWVSPYPIDEFYQPGYNSSAGYTWESVGTLLLTTVPAKARVTLNGVFIGTANCLGPIQLPIGEHSLRIEAVGHEALETTLRVERPGVQQMEICLKTSGETARLEPRF